MKEIDQWAILGAPPEFDSPLHVGQLNIPDYAGVEAEVRGIFGRRWYANHGPLSRELDARFAEYVGTRHAVAFANGTVSLIAMLAALQRPGEVIVPAFTFPATAQAIVWAGMRPVFCDVDPTTHNVSVKTIERVLSEKSVAILGVHLWGRACIPDLLADLARERGLRLLFDASHAIDCTFRGARIGGLGDAESFSFHATKIVNGLEGGIVATNDDQLSDRLRTIRSFHPGETHAPVALRMNGKMSEIQAAFALLGLRDIERYAARNRSIYDVYRHGLEGIPGAKVLTYPASERNNHQYVVVEVDASAAGVSRDELYAWLMAENVCCRRHFHPGAHRMPPFNALPAYRDLDLPVTDALSDRVLLLPNGNIVTTEQVDRICKLIRAMVDQAPRIRNRTERLA